MYSGGMTSGLGKDLIVIEIVNGHVRFIYDLGAGPRVSFTFHKADFVLT